jgi:6-phosphogluconolactonase
MKAWPLVLAACGGTHGTPIDNASPISDAPPARLVAYVGGYSTQIARYDVARGALTPATAITAIAADPSFLAVDPAGAHLYAVSESANRVGAYTIAPADGALAAIGDVASGGNGPAHVFVDRSGAYLLAANYGDGRVSVFAIQAGGGLAPAQQVVLAGTNAHEIVTDPSNHFAFVPCLGSDWVAQYTFDATSGTLTANAVPHFTTAAGAGPRHLAFSPDGHFGYLLAETASTLSALSLDGATGQLAELQTLSTLPAGFSGTNTGAEVWVHPSGAFVFASNRGDDSIATFSRDATSGMLALVGHTKTGGMTPRDFTLDPDGRFLYAANQASNTVVALAFDPASGMLSSIASSVTAQMPSFVGIVALP